MEKNDIGIRIPGDDEETSGVGGSGGNDWK